MRYVYIVLVFIVSLILQTTILPFLRLGSAMPNLLLVLVVFTGLFYGSLAGGAVGFSAGLVQDLLGGHYLGLEALSCFFAGYLMGCLKQRINTDNILSIFFLVLAGSLIAGTVLLLGQGILSSTLNIRLFWSVATAGALYDACLAGLLFKPLARLFSPIPELVEIGQPTRALYR